jgi:acyl-homoserine lactone acylase PvdQ
MRPGLVPLLVAVVLVASAPASAQRDYGRRVFNVLPPGQSGSIPPDENSTDQLRLYDGLTPLFDQVRAPDLRRYWKEARFGATGRTTRERTTRAGVTIVRDRYGVPHITARRRADVLFGAGWVTAADRGVLLETIRGPSKVAALDAPGLSAFNLAASLRQFSPSGATMRRLRTQRQLLRRTRAGRLVLRDAQDYLDGINAQYRSAGSNARPWTLEDSLGVGALIGAEFGAGGGDEVRNSMLLAGLQGRLGPEAGLRAFHDLRNSHDPETPVSIPGRFPYAPVPSGAAPGSAIVDPGSMDGSARRAAEQGKLRQTSIAMLVSGRRSATGHALAVMGIQVGYFYPNLFLEADLHGGGIDVRGIMLAGLPYPVIGRGRDFAWSITSASEDNTDQFLEELCEPDGSAPTRASRHYRYRGRCRPMTTFDAGLLAASDDEPEREVTYAETVHGPVSGTVTVGGRPYAVTRKRSTRGRDALSVIPLRALSSNGVRSARDFIRNMSGIEFTFNWPYLDDRDIALYTSGRLPIRAPGVDPGLPTLGTGEHEWRGFLRAAGHPQAVSPRSGAILNWNNQSGRGFAAADSDFSRGSVHRVELHEDLPRRPRLHDVAAVMNRAATQDLRAMEVWPVIARVLAGGPAPDARTQRAAELVTEWRAAGGSRLDRDLDGRVDHQGAAVLDAAWPRIATAVLQPALGPLVSDLAAIEEIDRGSTKINSNTSSYGVGWYSYVDKDLRTLLGERVRGRYSRRYCGNGDLAACRESLWASLQAAANELAAAQGEDPNGWFADANAERILFRPGVLSSTMRWTNRANGFEQVMEFGGHRPRR